MTKSTIDINQIIKNIKDDIKDIDKEIDYLSIKAILRFEGSKFNIEIDISDILLKND